MKIITKFGFLILISLFLFESCCEVNDKKKKNEENEHVFQIRNPNYQLSPYTGMTREHWKDAAKYILNGAFSYIHTLDDPMKFPKQPGKSYPQDEKRVPTEKLEGLCRTLFVAAPLLKENSELEINGIKVGEYYRHQMLKLIDPNSPSYIVPRAKDGGPSQNLVEFGALAISLFVVPEVIWDPLTQKQKDALANTMLSYGDGPTVPSNWRFFNIFVLSFFKDQGYDVNEKLLQEYLNKSLQQYRGDGWYNDSPAYDYYSMWAFQLYGVVWSEVFGNKYYPEIANQLINNFKDLNFNYSNLFSRDGKMMMYGRSISYRFASISPFPFMGKYGGKEVNLGWLRKISSSTLLQFLQQPEFLKDSVPTLGFYGAYEPAVQIYSCRGSVYWMGKAFLGLLLPSDDPFWLAKENNGPWEKEFKKDNIYNKFAKGSEILITDYPNIGASEIRAWCHEKVKDDWQKFRSTENYNRLSYNSIFLWQADGDSGEVAMNYLFKNDENAWEALRLYTFKKFEDGAYYRDAVLETNENVKMNLVDIPLPNGILRVDRNISSEAIDMRLGHYALPQIEGEITSSVKKVQGYSITIIDNGEYQLAMVPVLGWKDMQVVRSEGLNPSAKKSSVIDVIDRFDTKSNIPKVYSTLMLWKKSGEEWNDSELMPIKSLNVSDDTNKVTIDFVDGIQKIIEF